RVKERGLSVVNVGNDRDVADIVTHLVHCTLVPFPKWPDCVSISLCGSATYDQFGRTEPGRKKAVTYAPPRYYTTLAARQSLSANSFSRRACPARPDTKRPSLDPHSS